MNSEEIIKKIPDLKLEVKPDPNAILNTSMQLNGTRCTYDFYNGKEVKRDGKKYANALFTDYTKNSRSQKTIGTYYEYIPEIESIACMLCSIDTRIPLKKIPLKWRIDEVFFVTAQKEVITKYGDEWLCVTEDLVQALPFYLGIQSINHVTFNCMENINMPNENLQEAFSHLFPVVYLKSNESAVISTPNVLLTFLMHKEQKKKTGPKQKLIDEYVAMPLEDVKESELKGAKTQRDRRTNYTSAETYVKISKIKEGLCCLRWITKQDKTIIENVRIYVNGKDFIGCKKNNAGEYIQFRLSSGKDNFNSGKIIPFDKSILNGTVLQYFSSVFEEFEEESQSMYIWAFLQYPILEQLYKLGLKDIVKECGKSWRSNPLDTLSSYFGRINSKEKNIYKVLGINKHQFEVVIKSLDDKKISHRNTIGTIKEILTDHEPIDSIDNKTFDAVFDLVLEVKKMNKSEYTLTGILKLLKKLYSTKTMINMIPDIKDMFLECKTGLFSGSNYPSTYYDYLSMVEKVDDTKHFRPNFDSLEEISNMHLAVCSVYNLKREAYKLEAFQKQSDKWKKFVYEGEELSVIAPEHPGEVANEGIVLHHCVKSYIDRIISGSTNIVFIRKNTELSKPFFTVEISNSGTIEQVHGFGNRNADTEPGLEEFIKKWAKERKLKLTNFNKVR